MKIIPIYPDIQAPLHDRKALGALMSFTEHNNFETIGCVGDVLDGTQISQWTRGRKGEYVGTLAKDRDIAVQILHDLGITDLSRSNHDDRISKYINQYAPGLDGLPELEIESFLRLDELGIRFHKKPYEIAPGWLLMHGDEAGSSRIPGGLAMGLARRTGKSVVAGHSHKAGIIHDHQSYSGKQTRQLWGMEVGHIMDQKKASYLGAGYANWSQAFGVLIVDGREVTPMLIPIKNGAFYFDGVKYSG